MLKWIYFVIKIQTSNQIKVKTKKFQKKDNFQKKFQKNVKMNLFRN